VNLICWLKGHSIQNDYNYKRQHDDYICLRCHRKYDYSNEYEDTLSDWAEDNGLLIFTLAVLFTVTFFLVLVWSLDSVSCAQKANQMNLPHIYGLFKGCMVELQNQWLPLDAIKAVIVK
jgi:hypothetical protein